MSYNILGINTSHNSSVCVLSDGKIKFFLEEDRLSRIKYDSTPLETLRYISKKFNIDKIALGGIDYFPEVLAAINPLDNSFIFSTENGIYLTSNQQYLKSNDNYFIQTLSKYFPKIEVEDHRSHHHLLHAFSAFYNSSFTKSLVITIDGSGTFNPLPEGARFETETVFEFNYKNYPQTVFNNYRTVSLKAPNYFYPNLCRCYEIITKYCDFEGLEAGKTMGLASYGKENSFIPNMFEELHANKEIFTPNTLHDTFSIESGNKSNKFIDNFKKIIKKNKISKKDLAYHIQKDIELIIGDLIEKAIQNHPDTKNICLTGGFFLNCVANYKFKKRFPNINFYVEPLAGDAGQSIGAAKYSWFLKNIDNLKFFKKNNLPLNTLYNGPKYTKKELLKKINEYLD